jgi:hypothetical protein
MVRNQIVPTGYVRRLVVVLGVIVVLLTLMITLGTGKRSENRKIAADLVELHRCWDTNDNLPSLFQSLTNLPFREGAASEGKAYVYHRYGLFGMHWDEYYFIQQPLPVTNAAEWTLYHAWYWNGHRELAMHKLLTINAK